MYIIYTENPWKDREEAETILPTLLEINGIQEHRNRKTLDPSHTTAVVWIISHKTSLRA